MYNMDISILGYKINLEVLILIGVVYLILVGHTLGGCCNFYKIMEGMENKAKKPLTQPLPSAVPTPASKKAGTEGFVGANTNYGESSQYSLNDNTPVDTSSWMAPNLTVVPGQQLSAGVQNILNRPSQQLPLPEGELDFFASTQFKPECCPNTYSNSSGCACMTSGQYNYLITRSGNNVPYSEY
uniref:Uncharacterized protein n=1 Tax=viral metagenome TaxID=1070528 RepID=A0A6C0EQJ3_9ZZZZ